MWRFKFDVVENILEQTAHVVFPLWIHIWFCNDFLLENCLRQTPQINSLVIQQLWIGKFGCVLRQPKSKLAHILTQSSYSIMPEQQLVPPQPFATSLWDSPLPSGVHQLHSIYLKESNYFGWYLLIRSKPEFLILSILTGWDIVPVRLIWHSYCLSTSSIMLIPSSLFPKLMAISILLTYDFHHTY